MDVRTIEELSTKISYLIAIDGEIHFCLYTEV